MIYKLYRTDKGPVERTLDELLTQYKPGGVPVRIVVFVLLTDNEAYVDCRDRVQKKIKAHFGEKCPTVSVVAQPPYPDGIAMEVHEIYPYENNDIRYKCLNDVSYIVVESRGSKRLFISGIVGDLMRQNIREQSNSVFDTLSRILQTEQMAASSIIRQWNYIEKITAIEADGHQHYQDFNDARSVFYLSDQWENGYPAATGIGTQWGGVMVDADAMLLTDQSICIKAVNNPLQVSAHAYSQGVLLGEKNGDLLQKTTPKFERAKAVWEENSGFVYISGTAAIRGEKSLHGVAIKEQTLITLENISYLILAGNLQASGVPTTQNGLLVCLRVYVKRTEDLEEAREVIKRQCPNIPAVYTQADICRSELLIEIEGLAVLR